MINTLVAAVHSSPWSADRLHELSLYSSEACQFETDLSPMLDQNPFMFFY